MDFVSLGTNVKKLRKDRRLTQEQLAELSEISVAYLSKIENHRVNNVSLSVIQRLADVLGVTAGYLVAESDMDKMLDEEISSRLSKCSVNEKRTFLSIMDVLLASNSV